MKPVSKKAKRAAKRLFPRKKHEQTISIEALYASLPKGGKQ